MRIKKQIFFFLLAVAVMLPCGQAFAHPHQWIDVRTTLVFNTRGQLESIRERWLFDLFYTQLSMPDFDTNNDKTLDDAELVVLAQANIKNLREFDYFTTIETGQTKAVPADARDIETRLEDGRIALEFTVPLPAPADVAQGFSYKIYDPSYYVAMLHEKTDDAVRFEGIDAARCTANITRPEPDATWIALAASLDRNATAPDNLGLHFAETVSVTCR